MSSLSEALGESALDPAPEPAETPEGVAAPAEGVTPEGDAPPETPAEPAAEPAPQMVPIAAVIDERSKRQQAQQDLAYARGQLEARSQQPPAAQTPPVDPTDEYFKDPVAWTQKLVEETNRQRDQIRHDERFGASVALMQDSHEDYLEMEALFIENAREDPALAAKLRDHHNPAKFAYDWAKEFQNVSKYGSSMSEITEKIRAEERAKLEVEMGQKKAVDTASGVPPSTAGDTGAGSAAGPEWTKPSFDEIVPDNHFD